MDNATKPRLLFFRFTLESLPAYVRLHLQQHVKCLSQFFEVTVIDRPSDYRRLCDEHQPDLTLFESGIYAGQREITNISAYPEIPKLGFCHCDAYCETREVFISDMAKWGIETFFTISVSLAFYTPSLADNLFVWPNFVDPALYHDYENPKLIPFLFTGSQATHYPWRNRINKIISQYYPSLQCPHFGWHDGRATSRMTSGEPYARMINAAWIAPACGTIANEVVRKHFEIPACKACLVTERTPALEAAGFSDLVNCVFADDADVLEKVEWLFQHRDEFEKITRAGHDLVHSKHTIAHRDQIFQWFTLHKQLKPHQRVVQLGPFMPLTIVDRSSPIRNGYLNSDGLDRVLLAQGDENLWSGHYDEAETLYRKCLNYVEFMPEPRFRLALCSLYKGNADLAIRWISETVQRVLEKFGATEPDAVEWAYFIVALLCLGKLREAVARANQFETLCHPELDRVRAVIRVVSDQAQQRAPVERQLNCCWSVHQLPERKMEAWLDEICKMLKACRQDDFVRRLARPAAIWKPAMPVAESGGSSTPGVMGSCRLVLNGCGARGRKGLAARQEIARVGVAGYRARVKSRFMNYVERFALQPLRKIEMRIGFFLPYKWSAMQNDETAFAIRQLLREEDINSGLLIGAAAGEGNTEAFLAGMGENPNRPSAVCMNFATPRFIRLQKRLAKNSAVQCRSICEERGWHEDHNEGFDAVVIDGSEIIGEIGFDETHGARFIVLDDINAVRTYNVSRALLADRNYTLLAHNPSHRGGYAIFRRVYNPIVKFAPEPERALMSAQHS
jgi:hypothetical protein